MTAIETPSRSPGDDARSRRAMVRWLAAYVIGLAFSCCEDDDCVARVRRVAPTDARTLRRVRRRIVAAPAVVPAARQRALRLLDAASTGGRAPRVRG